MQYQKFSQNEIQKESSTNLGGATRLAILLWKSQKKLKTKPRIRGNLQSHKFSKKEVQKKSLTNLSNEARLVWKNQKNLKMEKSSTN